MKFAVLGGDERQIRLARLLIKDGHDVNAFAVGAGPLAGGCVFSSVTEAVKGADFVILPLPSSRDGRTLNAGEDFSEVCLEDIFAAAKGSVVFLGKAEEKVRALAEKAGARTADYFEREELTVQNAAITAEGAVQILMEKLPVTVSGLKVLVVGFGRIGKLTAKKLRDLGADVTVAARRQADLSWAEVLGYKKARTGKIETYPKCDAVVNTVPAVVLDEEALRRLGKDCFVLDLASEPGGVDFAAAKRLGMKTLWALSLPGKAAPESAAAAIKDTIYNIINEMECEI